MTNKNFLTEPGRQEAGSPENSGFQTALCKNVCIISFFDENFIVIVSSKLFPAFSTNVRENHHPSGISPLIARSPAFLFVVFPRTCIRALAAFHTLSGENHAQNSMTHAYESGSSAIGSRYDCCPVCLLHKAERSQFVSKGMKDQPDLSARTHGTLNSCIIRTIIVKGIQDQPP